MPVTPETSHSEMSPLKEAAPANILDMSVTPETSHSEMSPLKEAAPSEHYGHVSHARDVPFRDVAVEGGGIGEHSGHASHA